MPPERQPIGAATAIGLGALLVPPHHSVQRYSRYGQIDPLESDMRVGVKIATSVALLATGLTIEESFADRFQTEQNARCKLSYYWFTANREL